MLYFWREQSCRTDEKNQYEPSWWDMVLWIGKLSKPLSQAYGGGRIGYRRFWLHIRMASARRVGGSYWLWDAPPDLWQRGR